MSIPSPSLPGLLRTHFGEENIPTTISSLLDDPIILRCRSTEDEKGEKKKLKETKTNEVPFFGYIRNGCLDGWMDEVTLRGQIPFKKSTNNKRHDVRRTNVTTDPPTTSTTSSSTHLTLLPWFISVLLYVRRPILGDPISHGLIAATTVKMRNVTRDGISAI